MTVLHQVEVVVLVTGHLVIAITGKFIHLYNGWIAVVLFLYSNKKRQKLNCMYLLLAAFICS